MSAHLLCIQNARGKNLPHAYRDLPLMLGERLRASLPDSKNANVTIMILQEKWLSKRLTTKKAINHNEVEISMLTYFSFYKIVNITQLAKLNLN